MNQTKFCITATAQDGKAKIIELTKDVTQFLDNEIQYSSSQSLRFFSVLKKIGTVNEHLHDGEEHK
jgi:hypothetical protein